MSVKELNPYLFFNGSADKALALYERALDARTESLQRYQDMPGATNTCVPENKERVMHALVRIGQASVMVSDVPADQPGPQGGNVQVCLHFDDVEDMTRKFDALAASGKVTMGLHDTFWGARFGALTDEFGVHWMFNCQTKAQ
jgi:PhnB protein